MSSPPPTYTEEEAFQYLKRINFPLTNPPAAFPPANYETLRRLVACHNHYVPFENLSLHYSRDPKIDLDKDYLFDKFVIRRRGGYCMEQNRCFSILLRTLGYTLYTIGARVNVRGTYTGWSHMAIILTLDGTEYLVDVGFGGNGLSQPLAVFSANGEPIGDHVNGALPEQHRARLAEMPINAKKGHKVWFLESRRTPEAGWEPLYMFEKDTEFYFEDYRMYLPEQCHL